MRDDGFSPCQFIRVDAQHDRTVFGHCKAAGPIRQVDARVLNRFGAGINHQADVFGRINTHFARQAGQRLYAQFEQALAKGRRAVRPVNRDPAVGGAIPSVAGVFDRDFLCRGGVALAAGGGDFPVPGQVRAGWQAADVAQIPLPLRHGPIAVRLKIDALARGGILAGLRVGGIQ